MYDEYKMNARDEKEELRFDWVLAGKYLAQIFYAEYICCAKYIFLAEYIFFCKIHFFVQIIFFRYIRSQWEGGERLILHEDQMRVGEEWVDDNIAELSFWFHTFLAANAMHCYSAIRGHFLFVSLLLLERTCLLPLRGETLLVFRPSSELLDSSW